MCQSKQPKEQTAQKNPCLHQRAELCRCSARRGARKAEPRLQAVLGRAVRCTLSQTPAISDQEKRRKFPPGLFSSLSPVPQPRSLRRAEAVLAVVSLISSGGSSASPAPHADLHFAAFVDCEEIVIHSHGLEQRWFLSSFLPPPSSHTPGESPRMVPQGRTR
ncbi:hypothetical protein DV515_00007827 [Chloebia gouldiae]|uniref:Uncharacterized protein n=1 Tax=Chloebia gouldiae TaxID=44316 RepID=A0A3L8SH29_CHLGU|nr:hypothetical protein DV515_00007827 [Chloebia gouldiae]